MLRSKKVGFNPTPRKKILFVGSFIVHQVYEGEMLKENARVLLESTQGAK